MTDLSQLGGRTLVLFDGYCGLCNRSIRWFLRRDRLDRLRFAPATSAPAAELLARHGLGASAHTTTPDSILVVENAATPIEQILTRSNAVLAILDCLPAPWPAFAAVSRIIPRPLRDLAYRFIARIRYRIWGRYDTCPLPTATEREHFL